MKNERKAIRQMITTTRVIQFTNSKRATELETKISRKIFGQGVVGKRSVTIELLKI